MCFRRDDNLLDDVTYDAVVKADVIIEIDKIIWACETLRDWTAFLGDIKFLDEKIPLIEISVNELIAGEGRTLADLFDFRGERYFCMSNYYHRMETQTSFVLDWAYNLEGTPTYTVSLPLIQTCFLYTILRLISCIFCLLNIFQS